MVDTADRLSEFLPRLAAAPWVALDTEGDSLHAYPEKLCLVQISFPGVDEVVDPLSGFSLVALWEALRDRELIMHGCDYDLRLLRRCAGFQPRQVFDTMVAARLLGYRELSLTQLVAKNLNVTLEKGPQKMDWAKRPLTERMDRYARNDTRYLYPLSQGLRRELEEKGRLEWHRESCARLIQDSTERPEPDQEKVWRIRGSDRLDGRGLAVLRALWRWREAEAVQANRPPYFVLSHELLVSVAAKAAATQPFEVLLPRPWSKRKRQGLTEAVAEGLAIPSEALPRKRDTRGVRLGRAAQKRLEELCERRDRQAARLGLDPSVVASRASLVRLANAKSAAESDLMCWQSALLAKEWEPLAAPLTGT